MNVRGKPVEEFQYYEHQADVWHDYSQRTPDQLVRDVNILHRFTRQLVTEKGDIQQKLGFANQKIWLLTMIVTGEGALLVLLLTTVLEHWGQH